MYGPSADVMGCEELVHTLVSYIEESFGVEYSAVPEVVHASIADVESYVRDRDRAITGTEPDAATVHERAKHVYGSTAGIYDGINHRVLVMDNAARPRVLDDLGGGVEVDPSTMADQGELVYILAHELVHGYQRNHGAPSEPELITANARSIQQEKVSVKGRLAGIFRTNHMSEGMQLVYGALPALTIIEGQADYMAMGALLAHKDELPEAAAYAAQKYVEQTADSGGGDYRTMVQGLLAAKQQMEAGKAPELCTSPQFAHALKDAQYIIGFDYIAETARDEGHGMDWFVENLPDKLEAFL
ncbi:MAG: hypothetical protein QGG50_00705 [Methanopyri archaeon]|jgi:hypothetical protein|nr:hypothetical protein [Methanopyri archaeon]